MKINRLHPGQIASATEQTAVTGLDEKALKRVAGGVAPFSCAILIETQDIHSAFARLLGRRWQHFKHREHLVHFHRGTLEEALRRSGLRLAHLQRRAAGKYVRGDFLVERSARLHPSLPRILRPVLGGPWSIYLNFGDEMIAVAEPRP